jgi:O-antigen/teichoic acid export membrane protein
MAGMAPDCDRAEVLRTLKKDTWGYAISLGPLGLGGLALLPLMTQLLTPAELGWLAVAEALLLPAGTLGMMGLKFAYLYRFAHITPRQQQALMATCLALGGLISLACGLTVAALTIHPALLEAMGWEGPVPLHHPWLLVLLVPTGTMQALLMTELRAQRALRGTAWVSYGQLAATLGATAGMTVGFGWGLDGFLGGQLVGQIWGLAQTALYLAARRRAQREGDEGREEEEGQAPSRSTQSDCAFWAEAPALLRYGWPLTAGLLVRYGMDSLSRVMLAGLASLQAAADWLVVSRLLSVFDVLVANPFFMAWGGLMHHVLRRPDAAQAIGSVSSWALVSSSMAAVLMMSAFLPLSQMMTGQARADLALLFVLLLWSKWLVLVKSPLCCGVQQSGQTDWALRNNALALLVFAPAGWLLMRLPPPWGQAHGLAVAMLVATLIPTATLYSQSQRSVHQKLGALPWVAAASALVATAGLATLDIP